MAWNNNVANILASAQQNRESLRARRDIAQMRYGNNTSSGGDGGSSLSVKDAIGLAIKFNEAKDAARDSATKWENDQLQRLKDGVARIKAAGLSPEAERLEMQTLCGLFIDKDTTLGQVMNNVSGGIVDDKGNGVLWTPGNKEHIPIVTNMAYAAAQQQGIIQQLEQQEQERQAQEQQAQEQQAQEQQAQEPDSNIPYYKVPRWQQVANRFTGKASNALNERQQELIDTLSGDGYNKIVDELKKQGLNDTQITQTIADMLQDVGLNADNEYRYKVSHSQRAKNLASFKWKNGLNTLNARQQELIDTFNNGGYNKIVDELKKQGLNDEQIKQKIEDMMRDVGLRPAEPRKKSSEGTALNLESNVDPEASVASPSKNSEQSAKVDYYNMIQDCLEKGDCSALPPELQEVVFKTARNSFIGQKDGKPAVFNPSLILPYLSDGRVEQISNFKEQNDRLASMFPAMKSQIDAEAAQRDKYNELMHEIQTNTPEYFRAVAYRQEQDNTINALNKQGVSIKAAKNTTQLQNAVSAVQTKESDPSRLGKVDSIQPKVIKGGSGNKNAKDEWNLHAQYASSESLRNHINRSDAKYKDNSKWRDIPRDNIGELVKFYKDNNDVGSLRDLYHVIENAMTTFRDQRIIISKSHLNTPLSDKEFSKAIISQALNMTAEQLEGPNSENNIITAAIRKFMDILPADLSDDVYSRFSAALKGKDPLIAATIKNMYSTAYVSAKDLATLRAAGLNDSVLRHVFKNFRAQMDSAVEYAIDNKPNSVIFIKRRIDNAIHDIKINHMLDAYKQLDTTKTDLSGTGLSSTKNLEAVPFEEDGGIVVRFRDPKGKLYQRNRVNNKLIPYKGN